MAQICWYFHIHQPWRIRPYSVFDIGVEQKYFAVPREFDFANDRVMEKVAEKSYRPMFILLEKLLLRHPDFCFALSITGVVLEQMQAFAPDLIARLQRMVATGRVEIIAETYYHSLASLYSEEEFVAQVELHTRLIHELFGVSPQVFRNTELVYSNDIAQMVDDMGFIGMLAEGADRVLHGRAPTHLYHAAHRSDFPVLLKHYHLSDDLAFRFSQQSWPAWPLRADTYVHWLTQPFGADEVINLFMDFETFGEHQWESTGIFTFFEQVISQLSSSPFARFVTPSQVIAEHESDLQNEAWLFDAPDPISWADVDRDLTAWCGNPLQWDTLQILYGLEAIILELSAAGNTQLLEDWRLLQTSDHFYYMCTKWSNDGDVHAYFSPYGSPYDAYVNFNNVLADFQGRVL